MDTDLLTDVLNKKADDIGNTDDLIRRPRKEPRTPPIADSASLFEVTVGGVVTECDSNFECAMQAYDSGVRHSKLEVKFTHILNGARTVSLRRSAVIVHHKEPIRNAKPLRTR